MSAISTFAIHRWLEQRQLYAWGGATMENVVFRDIFTREGTELFIACDKVAPDMIKSVKSLL